MKIRAKITLLFALLVTVILLLVSFTVYYFTALERQDLFFKRLQSRASYNAQIFTLVGDTSVALMDRINNSVTIVLPKKAAAIYTTDGKLLYRFSSPDTDSLAISPEVINSILVSDGYRFHLGERQALGLLHSSGDRSLISIMAAYDEDGFNRLKQLKQIFVLSTLLGIVIAFITGYYFSNQLLRPLAHIIREAKDISSQNLSQRIKLGASHDEMHQLASTFNDLLDRLQESFTTQRRFISNASHELSTPLTSISSQLQVALQRERDIDEYRRVILSVQEDVQELLLLTKSLLEIAKTGSTGSIELDAIRIDEILFRVISDVHKLDSQYQVILNFAEVPDDDESFLVFGNADLLFISIRNIVENGCKFSSDHVSHISLNLHSKEIIIQVSSVGEAIPEADHENIFQPFYRTATASTTPGFGLGLALARRIISLHKGRIEVNSHSDEGNIFSIHLPRMNHFDE